VRESEEFSDAVEPQTLEQAPEDRHRTSKSTNQQSCLKMSQSFAAVCSDSPPESVGLEIGDPQS